MRYHEAHVWRILRSSAGAASGPPGGRWSATSKRSGIGSECAGRSLKKSARRAAHHRLHRRKRTERATPSGAHLGPARTDPGAAISFQLEGALGRRPASPGGTSISGFTQDHPRPAGGGLPRPSAAPSAGPTAGNLGLKRCSRRCKTDPGSGVNPIGWTVVRREIGPGCGRVVPRTARAKDNRAPSAVCGCCIPRR